MDDKPADEAEGEIQIRVGSSCPQGGEICRLGRAKSQQFA